MRIPPPQNWIDWLCMGMMIRVGWWLIAPATDALQKAVSAFHG